jgi:hypothetical protein
MKTKVVSRYEFMKMLEPLMAGYDNLTDIDNGLGKLKTLTATMTTGKAKMMKAIEELADAISLNQSRWRKYEMFLWHCHADAATKLPRKKADAERRKRVVTARHKKPKPDSWKTIAANETRLAGELIKSQQVRDVYRAWKEQRGSLIKRSMPKKK